MNTTLLAAAGLAALLAASPAEAKTVDGWLAQCTAVAAGSCTEQTATGYLRQPVSFSTLGAGSTVNSTPYSFATGVTGTIAGRAVYDAATGGHLLFVLPLASAYTIPSIGDRGDVGALKFILAALVGYPTVEAFSGSFAAGAMLGTTSDGSSVTAGTNETFTRGVLAANPGSADALPIEVLETTGFSYQIPASASTVDIQGAGTLATGTEILPQAPSNGLIERLECNVTVTTLTITPGSGTTIIGSAPTSCGANTSHELQYLAADTTWHVLF